MAISGGNGANNPVVVNAIARTPRLLECTAIPVDRIWYWGEAIDAGGEGRRGGGFRGQ